MHKISWKKYILKKQTEPPNKLLKQALSCMVEKNIALDIGAGSLVDTQLLLHEGFKSIEAFDVDKTSTEIAKTIIDKRLIFNDADITTAVFKENHYNIINAQYFLPYLSKKEIKLLIPHLYKSLKPAGVFTGQFFGEKDSWNIKGDYRTYHTETDVKSLFKSLNFKILFFESEEGESVSRLGKLKYNHILNFIVQK